MALLPFESSAANITQVQNANEVFNPGAAEVTKPKHILAAMAEVLVKKAEQIAAAGKAS